MEALFETEFDELLGEEDELVDDEWEDMLDEILDETDSDELKLPKLVRPVRKPAVRRRSRKRPKKIARSRMQLPSTTIPNYTRCDFIVSGIDVSAQDALYLMLKGDSASQDASVQMLAAVNSGRLGGIFQEDQGMPGRRGRQLGLGWYGPLIDTYRKSALHAACVPPAQHKSHRKEIIVFRKKIAQNHHELARQLKLVWEDCTVSKIRPKLQPVPPRGGGCSRLSKDKNKPGPKTVFPGICVHPEHLKFVATMNSPQELIVRNCGDGIINWRTNVRYKAGSKPWIQLSRTSGSASYSTPEMVRVKCIKENLPKIPLRENQTVTHVAEIIFYSSNELVSPRIMPVAVPVTVQQTGIGPTIEPDTYTPKRCNSGILTSPGSRHTRSCYGGTTLTVRVTNTHGVGANGCIINNKTGKKKPFFVGIGRSADVSFQRPLSMIEEPWFFTIILNAGHGIGWAAYA